jgi:HSP20 family molecular chaperone IbpA
MHTIIRPLKSASRSRRREAAPTVFRKPHFDCAETAEALTLSVYVPGVDASGVEITTQGPDLTVTARKAHVVRVNWQALHLEHAQRDYRLSLRLGRGVVFDQLEAEIHQGVLTLRLPKCTPGVMETSLRHECVA